MSQANAIVVFVEPGAALPEIGHDFITSPSPLTGITYCISVTRIVGLSWTADGDLVVTVQGMKRAVDVPPEEK